MSLIKNLYIVGALASVLWRFAPDPDEKDCVIQDRALAHDPESRKIVLQ
jgi:hypothetical protein